MNPKEDGEISLEEKQGPGFGQKVMFKEHAVQRGTALDFSEVSVEGVFL